MFFKKFLSSSFILLSVVVIFPNVSTDAQKDTSYNPPVVTANSTETSKEKGNGNPLLACSIKTFSDLKSVLSPSLQQHELIETLGEPNQILTSAMDSHPLWRYDICPFDSYQFNSELDTVDIVALAEDQLKYIVFVNFSMDGSKIDHIATYYKTVEGAIHEYREYVDGSIKETEIY